VIGVLTWMALGALLMVFVFNVSKFKESLPLWYANYTTSALAKGEEFVGRNTFDKAVFIVIFLVFLIAWPLPLYKSIRKSFKGE